MPSRRSSRAPGGRSLHAKEGNRPCLSQGHLDFEPSPTDPDHLLPIMKDVLNIIGWAAHERHRALI
jgi:hypothetical protein